MTAGAVARSVFEWVFRRAALREARAGLTAGNDQREAAIHQAKLLLEVARRVEQPADALPPGAHAAVALALYRDAIYWALVARRSGGGAPPSDLRALWEADAAVLGAGRPAGEASAALRRALVDDYDPRSLAVSAADTAAARAFAEALLWDAAAAQRRVSAVHVQRGLRLAAVALGVSLLVAGVRLLARGPDLAAGKPFRISQPWPGFAECVRSEDCAQLMFVTEMGYQPWVEIDLGTPPKTIHRVEVRNRSKCCQERAVPLIVEISTDGVSWAQVARRDEEFNSWTATFRPKVARYVRLKALKSTMLHLKSIAVR